MSAQCCRSECTPSRLARIRQLKLDGRDSEKTNDGRLVRVLLYPVIMRGLRYAPDKSPRGNRNRAVRIEVGTDRLGLDRVYVQAKRYAQGNSVGRPDVQAFVGSLVGLGATKGVFVTTSSFSHQALDFVRHLSQRVILIDGQRLADLMIEHNVGVRLSRAVECKRLDEDFFAEED
jgi:hypothetical protein